VGKPEIEKRIEIPAEQRKKKEKNVRVSLIHGKERGKKATEGKFLSFGRRVMFSDEA